MHDYGEEDRGSATRLRRGRLEEDGLKVIDILAHHPSTAHFISLGLARHFAWLKTRPRPNWWTAWRKPSMKTDGDLRAVGVETMFLLARVPSPEGAGGAQ